MRTLTFDEIEFVAGGDGECQPYDWRDIGVDKEGIHFNLGQIQDLIVDARAPATDFFEFVAATYDAAVSATAGIFEGIDEVWQRIAPESAEEAADFLRAILGYSTSGYSSHYGYC